MTPNSVRTALGRQARNAIIINRADGNAPDLKEAAIAGSQPIARQQYDAFETCKQCPAPSIFRAWASMMDLMANRTRQHLIIIIAAELRRKQ